MIGDSRSPLKVKRKIIYHSNVLSCLNSEECRHRKVTWKKMKLKYNEINFIAWCTIKSEFSNRRPNEHIIYSDTYSCNTTLSHNNYYYNYTRHIVFIPNPLFTDLSDLYIKIIYVLMHIEIRFSFQSIILLIQGLIFVIILWQVWEVYFEAIISI